MSTPPPAIPASMTEALSGLWRKFLPDIELRVGLVEAAAKALESNSLSREQREEAHDAAHKLAGILGTFSLPHGTDLARNAECLLAEEISPASATELNAWVRELRLMVNGKQ